MSTAEDAARAALLASKSINQGQQALTEESRLLLAALLRDEMRMAVTEGISAALTDENAERFWSKGMEVLQAQAANRAGLLVLSGLKKALGMAAIVLALYALGGWTAAKTAIGLMTKG